jgi:hypothetical protein
MAEKEAARLERETDKGAASAADLGINQRQRTAAGSSAADPRDDFEALEAKSLLAVKQFKVGSTVRVSDDRPSEGGGAGRKRMRASAKGVDGGGSSSTPQPILYAESEILFPKGQQTQEALVPPDIPHPTRGRDEDEVEGGEVFVLEAFAIATSP